MRGYAGSGGGGLGGRPAAKPVRAQGGPLDRARAGVAPGAAARKRASRFAYREERAR